MLRSALWSALRQEDVDVRVVVVDDASVDETPERLAIARHGALTVLRNSEVQGVSATRNLGLEHARTEWVAFLDDDDVWAPFHLSALFRAINSDSSTGRIDIACSGSLEIGLDRTVMDIREAPDPKRVPDALHYANVLQTPSRVLLRADVLRSAGGFDPDLSVVADWDLWLRIGRPGAIAVSPELSVGYTNHAENMHLAADLALKELTRLEERHAPRSTDKDFTASCSRWIAECYRTAGERPRAARWYLKSFRHDGEIRDIGRAVGALAGERLTELSGLRNRPVVPEGVAPWLGEIREVDRLPSEDVSLFGGNAPLCAN
jgi:glycosyltransferase involved in cell wall biosynthesis